MQADRGAGDRERSIPELMRELSSESATLVRQEMQLARVELMEKGKIAAASATFFGGAAALGLGAFGAFTACLIAAISLALAVWAAALIVAVAYALIALAFAMRGRDKWRRMDPVPRQTAQTVKEDIAWAKTQTKSGDK